MAVNLVVVEVVVLLLLLLAVEARALLDSFLALEVVGFIKLRLALGVVRRALAGLEGVRVVEVVIRIGLERAVMLGVEVVGFMTLLENPLFFVKSCWLFDAEELDLLRSSFEFPLRRLVVLEPT